MSDLVAENAKKADDMIRQLAAARAESVAVDTVVENVEDPVTPTEPAVQAPVQPSAPVVDEVAQLRAEVARLTHEYGVEHQRYKSLFGKIEQREKQVEQLTEIIANMQAAPPAPEKPVYLSEEDEDKFGSDLVDMSTRAAQHVYAQREAAMADVIASLREELAQVKNQVGGVQQETFQNKFAQYCAQVEAAVDAQTGGQFQAINTDPKFTNWISGSPARTMLFDTARKQLDVDGMLTLYDLYAKTMGMGTPQDARPLQQSPAVDPRLERQVAPGKSRGTPVPAEQPAGAKRQWTRSGIVDFYNKKPSMPKDTASALENDIFLAQKEGRVDFNR